MKNSHYVKFTNQLSFETRFPKSGPTYRMRKVVTHKHREDIQFKALNSPVEYPIWEHKFDIRVSDGNVLKPIFENNVQGRKNFRKDRTFRTNII